MEQLHELNTEALSDAQKPNGTNLDENKYIKRLSISFLLACLLTIINYAIYSLAIYYDVYSLVLFISMLIFTICYLLLSIRAYTAIKRRKENALFNVRFILIISLVLWLPFIVMAVYSSIWLIFEVVVLISIVISLYLAFFSKKIKMVIPKDNRKAYFKDYLLCVLFVILPFVIVGVENYHNKLIEQEELRIEQERLRIALDAEINNVQEILPIHDNYYMVHSSVVKNTDCVEWNIMIKEEMVDVVVFDQYNLEKWASLLLQKMSCDERFITLLEFLMLNETDVKFVLTGNKSGYRCESRMPYTKITESFNNLKLINSLTGDAESYDIDYDFEYLRVDAEQTKIVLPIILNENVKLTDVSVTKNGVSDSYEIINVKRDDFDLKLWEESFYLYMLYNDNSYDFLSLVNLNCGKECILYYDGKLIGSFTFSHEDLYYAMNNKIDEKEFEFRRFKSRIDFENRKYCPIEIMPGMNLTKMSVDDKYIIIEYRIDEDYYDLDYLLNNKKEFEEYLGTYIIPYFGQDIMQYKKGISVRYKGKRYKKQYTYTKEYKDLIKILK